jgi:predicted adenine nucleotide alpha hydrolase (AANH) superfamily ATPase
MILRAKEQEKLINRINQTLLPYHNQRVIELLKGSYENEKFYQLTEGLEKEKERGKRCLICYKLRLDKTALLAKEQGFEYFVTTLTISPLKDAKMINELGYQIQNETLVKWLPSDFKKKNGYQRSLELSKQLGLYRQNYCGCEFSLEKN